MKIYYDQTEYEVNKHKILYIWLTGADPELLSNSVLTGKDYSILEVQEEHNPIAFQMTDRYTDYWDVEFVPALFYVNNSGEIVRSDTDEVVPLTFIPPQSMHIAALTAVNASTKKGTIVRKWMGENYTYEGCYVSLQALEAYQAGKVKLYDTSKGINAPENADSFVLVYFVSENPYDEALEIPVIVDKLVK